MKKNKITALILLENHFYKDEEGNVWCNRIVDYHYLERYLQVFDKIIVCARFSSTNFDVSNRLLVSGQNVEFLELPDFRGTKGLMKNYFRVKKIIKKNKSRFSCCIMRAPAPLAYATYSIFLKNHIPLAIELVVAADKMIEGKGIIKNTINHFLILEAKKMCRKANGVSYVTSETLQKEYPCQALKNPSSNFFTANYSSIDLEKNMFFQQKWRKEEKPKEFKIVHTGYMDSYRKGQDKLIYIAHLLVQRGYTNFKIEFIGDGEKKNEFQELAKKLQVEKYIDFSGLIASKYELLQHLRESHIFVLPTTSEGLPRAMIEAMASGLACIASPVDGNVELLEEECLIDFNDLEGYCNKIIYFMENWKELIQNGQRNFLKSLEYEKSNLDKKREEFYKKLYELGKNL